MLQKSYKKVFALLLAFTFALCNVTPGLASGFMSITEITPYSTGQTNASTIYFGKNSKGTGTELNAPIQWRVLAVNESVDPETGNKNKSVLLLSQKGLYEKKFHSNTTNNKWGKSEIRKDMSGLVIDETKTGGTGSDEKSFDELDETSFAKTAFEAAEYNAIRDTKHEAGNSDTTESTDRIFLLSTEEVAENTGYFKDMSDRKTTNGVAWWLRSPKDTSSTSYVCEVKTNGYFPNYAMVSDSGCVRPALNLDPSKVLFLSAAVGGKASAACGGAFGLVDYTGTNGWKVTLKDAYDATTNPNGIKSPVVGSSDITTSNGFNVNTLAGKALSSESKVMNIGGGAQQSGTTHYISYNEDTAGANMYVSALLYNSDGTTMANYAKVASVGTSDSESGVFALNLSSATQQQKIKFFAEQENGDKMTDYASEFTTDDYTVTKTAETSEPIKTLSADYADKGLTANLFADAELGFESRSYDTNIIVDANNTGKITADANGTTLTGVVTVGEGATLTTVNEFTLAPLEGTNNEINGTLTGAPVTIAGSTTVGDKGKINSGLNFNLDGHQAGYTFITATSPINLSGITIGLVQTDTDYKLAEEGDKMILIKNVENNSYTGSSTVTTTKGLRKYTYSVTIEEAPTAQSQTEEETTIVTENANTNVTLLATNNKKQKTTSLFGDSNDSSDVFLGDDNDDTIYALMLGYLRQGAGDKTKSFNEARLAASAALNSASDLIATSVIDSANTTSKEWKSFVSLGGSHSRYETGSHVDLNMFNVAAGLSKVVLDNLTLGVFAEGGSGRYSTENNFADGVVTSDGNINYFGGGIFAKVEGKKTSLGHLHGEASFRAGYINSKYDSDNFNPGTNTSFNLGTPYVGIHAGFGYKWALAGNSNVDTYMKYFWNRQGSDNTTLDGERFDFDAINSHRLRLGARYNGRSDKNGFNFFGGLAYEYEFDGKAKGHMGEYALLEPDFKGGSGMAEIGFKFEKEESPWRGELALQGFTGKRDSIGANLSVWYMFGK